MVSKIAKVHGYFGKHLVFRLNFPDNTLYSALFPSVYLSINLSGSTRTLPLLLFSVILLLGSIFRFLVRTFGGAEATSTTEKKRKSLWGKGGLCYNGCQPGLSDLVLQHFA